MSRAHRARQIATVNAICARKIQPSTLRSEAEFDTLQKQHAPPPEYGYEPLSLFERAAHRAVRVLACAPHANKPLKALELGAGDGMLGALLAAAGHDVTLSDLEDWRAAPARKLRFIAADCCVEIPASSNEYDVVCSFNTFEHLTDPENAIAEVHRVTAYGGVVLLDFGPLYCSPWGLHAYRSLKMPYSQFLFSPEFIKMKLEELGIWDLGKSRSELQSLNGWKCSQFEKLWRASGFHVVQTNDVRREEYMHVVTSYPECFTGRGLSFDDLTCANIVVMLRKGEQAA
jgi:SAM-dependent methyltransferase